MTEFKLVAEEDLLEFEKKCNKLFEDGWKMTKSYAKELTAIATFERKIKPINIFDMVPCNIGINTKTAGCSVYNRDVAISFVNDKRMLEIYLTKDQVKEIQDGFSNLQI